VNGTKPAAGAAAVVGGTVMMIGAPPQERMLAGKALPAREVDAAPDDPVQTFVQGTGKTGDAVAKVAGVSRETVRKVEQIIAKATPEVVAKVRNGELSINAAAKIVTPPKPVQAAALVPPKNYSASKMVAAPVETRAKVKLEVNELAALREDHAALMAEHNDLLAKHDELKASFATTPAVIPDPAVETFIAHREETVAASRVDAGEDSPALDATDQVISLVTELRQLRGHVAELKARLDAVLDEHQTMDNILAADDKVQASMAEAKKHKAKAKLISVELQLGAKTLQSACPS
jgi:hypothetical protein